MCRELDVVECAGLDRLHRTVLRQLLGPVVVEPLVDLLAPTPLRERLLGGLRAPAQFGVQADHQLHDERRRRGLRCGSGLLADGQRTHVQAAVDELGPDGGERQAVALHRLDDARFERPPIGVAQEGGERPEPVVGGLQFPLARCRRLERHGGWRSLGGAVGHGAPFGLRATQPCQSTDVNVIRCLVSTQAWLRMREEFGVPGTESGPVVAWVIDTIIRELRAGNTPP